MASRKNISLQRTNWTNQKDKGVRVRIIRQNGRYKVQRKFLWWWVTERDYHDDKTFKTVRDARQYIRERIIQENDRIKVMEVCGG